jgi:hypothetical protein
MESEKVKEIKKALECCSTLMDNNATSEEQDKSCNECPYRINDRCSWKLDKDALTLINEFESENERLNECYKVKAYDKLRAENKQLKDRIALLEKENELLRNAKVVYENVDYCYEDLKKAEKRIAELEKEKEETMKAWYEDREGMFWDGVGEGELKGYKQLKQFAERLIEKKVRLGDRFNIYDIDETLKEFINERI